MAKTRRSTRVVLATLLASLVLVSPASAGQVVKARVAPRIPSTAGVDESVRVTPGTWPMPGKRTYQWLLNGKAIARATGPSLKLTMRMDGAQIKVRESVDLGRGRTGSALSNTLTVGRLTITGEPTLAFVSGSTTDLVVTPPEVSPAAGTIRYTWLRNGFDIGGATTPKYSLTPADKGATLSVQVSITRDGYLGRTLVSNTIDIPNTATKYTLLWSDEFNGAAGSAPDPRYWVAQDGDGRNYPPGAGWGNAERQYYRSDLASTDGNGNLTITAKRDGAGAYSCWYNAPCEWLSSKYVTQDKLGMKYGRVEVRMKAPAGVGTWPAFWLLGTDFTVNTVRWPKCGELDVVELLGRDPRTVYGTTHGPLSGGQGRGGTAQLAQAASSDFHVYRMDWTSNQITFLVDEKPYYTVDRSDGDWVFDHEFFLLLNLAMGGNWGGSIDSGLSSATMQVDYVRIYSIDGVGEVFTH